LEEPTPQPVDVLLEAKQEEDEKEIEIT